MDHLKEDFPVFIPKETTYSCSVCYKSFGRKSNLETHERIHTGAKPFKCPICAKCFTASSSCKRHEKNCPESLENQTVNSSLKSQTNSCDVGSKSFGGNEGYLKVHMISHTTGEKRFTCPICGKGFTQRSRCLQHETIHVKRSEVCYFCGKRARGYGLTDLTRHMRIHTNEKPFRCDFCSEVFNDPSVCLRHKKSHPEYFVQNPDKKLPSFSCYFCDKRLRDNVKLELHMRTHTGERPFSCEFCFRSYCARVNLWRHCKLHPEYILRRTLVPSYRKFVIYPCYFCGQLCREYTELEVHLRSHTGERPFRCGICCKSATDPALYSRHAKLHHIKRSEPCSLLERTF